jgi:hypothetical protein
MLLVWYGSLLGQVFNCTTCLYRSLCMSIFESGVNIPAVGSPNGLHDTMERARIADVAVICANYANGGGEPKYPIRPCRNIPFYA